MTNAPFHPDLDREEFAQRLAVRFSFLQSADPKTIADVDASLGRLPTRGQPINVNTVALFRQADAKHRNGTTLETAIELAMEQFPDVKPRRRRTKKIDGHTDPDHDKFMLLAEYKRYRGLLSVGLDPAIPYSTNNLFEFILTRQWQKAAAVFAKANKEQRARYCLRLNRMQKVE